MCGEASGIFFLSVRPPLRISNGIALRLDQTAVIPNKNQGSSFIRLELANHSACKCPKALCPPGSSCAAVFLNCIITQILIIVDKILGPCTGGSNIPISIFQKVSILYLPRQRRQKRITVVTPMSQYPKNVLQFLPISAHNQTPPIALPMHTTSLLNVIWYMVTPTHETAPLFLYIACIGLLNLQHILSVDPIF